MDVDEGEVSEDPVVMSVVSDLRQIQSYEANQARANLRQPGGLFPDDITQRTKLPKLQHKLRAEVIASAEANPGRNMTELAMTLINNIKIVDSMDTPKLKEKAEDLGLDATAPRGNLIKSIIDYILDQYPNDSLF